MNYNSVEEIFTAGTTNMTVIRDNKKQDDGTDTIEGVSWFVYNDQPVTTIYVSGNSYIGFNSNTKTLEVNQRDGAMYYLYREEGTLYREINFLKIRFKGYSSYNQTANTYVEEYDVILWSTGDISLHMISIPTSYNSGAYQYTEYYQGKSKTHTFTVTSSSPDITFQKSENDFCTVYNRMIQIDQPLQLKYLVRSGSTYYTINNNALTQIRVSALTSEVFQQYGVSSLPLSLLPSLNNPEVICYIEEKNYVLNTGLTVYGIPPLPQIFYFSSIDISGHTGIEKIECYDGDDNTLFSISVDNGQIWKYYNNGWNTVQSDSQGMPLSVLHALTSLEWSELVTSSTSTIQVRCILTTSTSFVGSRLYIRYL